MPQRQLRSRSEALDFGDLWQDHRSPPKKRTRRAAAAKAAAALAGLDPEDRNGTSSGEEPMGKLLTEEVPTRRAAAAPAAKKRKVEGVGGPMLEFDVATVVGLDPTGMSEEEEAELPPTVDPENYVKVRNHILARWRADPSQYLSEEHAALKVSARYQSAVPPAWRFLDSSGYINYGVAAALRDAAPGGPLAPAGAAHPKETVIVIGAGLAGLAAARQLRHKGYKVLVLEGRHRPGGRVYSTRLEGNGVFGVADLGGSIITGALGNPLAVLAIQAGVPLQDIRTNGNDETPLYMDNGQLVDWQIDNKAHEQYNEVLDEVTRHVSEISADAADALSVGVVMKTMLKEKEVIGDGVVQQNLFDWHLANLEFANASAAAALSLRHWDQDDPFEMQGEHCFPEGCNARLVEPLAADLPILYNAVVTGIDYSPAKGVTVHTADTSYSASAALVTVPLGVLKAGYITFNPPLPETKLAAIKRLNFGILNKVVLLFDHVFWNASRDMFGHVMSDPKERGAFYLFYSFAHISGGAVLTALVAGEAAARSEEQPAGVMVERAMAVVRRIHEAQGIKVPDPLQAVVTRWGSDPLCHGSYSSLGVGASGDDYDELAATVSGRLFFGGEATIRKWPATMHGAFLSGIREATKIMAALKSARRSGGRNTVDRQGLQVAPAPQLPPSREGLASAQRIARLSAGLAELFAKVEADLEFGCIKALYGPMPSKPGMTAGGVLVQIDFSQLRSGVPRRPMAVYVVLTPSQLSALRDVRGGDEARIVFLAGDCGVRLVQRQALDDAARDLARLIAADRKVNIPSLEPWSPTASVHQTVPPAVPVALAAARRDGTASVARPSGVVMS